MADGQKPDRFTERLKAAEPTLTAVTRRVARFIDQNRVAALATSAAELAARIGTSDASVVRAVQALGYAGLADLRQELVVTLDGRSTPADDLRRTLAETGENVERAIAQVIETHRASVAALAEPAMQAKIAEGVRTLHPVERITVFGIGPSSALARYLVTLLRRDGRRVGVLDATGRGLADQLLELRPGDGLLLLAYGRPYREVITVMQEARRLDLPIVLVSDSLAPRLARQATVVIPAQRGKADRVALHATTVAALEALVLGLAACDRDRALQTLERLNDLRLAMAAEPVGDR